MEQYIEELNSELRKLRSRDDLVFEDIQNYTSYLMNKYGDYLNVGKIVLLIATTGSVFSSNKTYNKVETYNNGEISENYLEVSRSIKDDGDVKIKIYPKKNHKFTENENIIISDIFNNVFICYSRPKYLDLINKARTTDALTEIPNFGYFRKFCFEMQQKGKLNDYTIVFSNIKQCKKLNSIFGADANQVIKQYYQKIDFSMDSDEVVAHLGGDNSIALVNTKDLDKFLNYLKEIDVTYNDQTINMHNVSGIYKIYDNNISIEKAIEYAKMALEIAKSRNLSSYEFIKDDEIKYINEEKMEENIKLAMKNKELVTFYQPKVEIRNSKLIGSEALIRWFKDGNIIPPSSFISILERKNLICNLDYYVLERVCEDIRNWQKRGITPVRTSINFSTRHIDDDDFVKKIIKTVSDYKVKPEFIEIEITELTDFKYKDVFEKIIRELRDYGFKIAMDDFGSGYSSLNLLRNKWYDIVKLDKELVDNIMDNESQIITEYAIKMLKSLNMEVVAEGVESKEQLEILKQLGCDIIQGYYFDRPLSNEAFTKKLINKQYNR